MKRRKSAKTWDVCPVRTRGGPAWRLRRSTDMRGKGAGKEVVSTIGGWRADCLLPLIVDVVRRQGHKAEGISKRVRPYPLPEEEGYRLALAFKAVRSTKSMKKAEAIVEAARGFEHEEAYLWYSYLSRATGNGKEAKLAAALGSLGEALW